MFIRKVGKRRYRKVGMKSHTHSSSGFSPGLGTTVETDEDSCRVKVEVKVEVEFPIVHKEVERV